MTSDLTSKQAQRLWPRWFIAGTKPVKVDLGPAGSGPLVDVGGGGFRVQSLAPLRRGAEVPVRIDIPEQASPLQCTGIVVWSKPNGAAGVRFAGLDEAQKKLLHGWLAELERTATTPTSGHQDEFTTVVSQIRGAQLNNADALNLIVRRVKELNSVCGAAIALGTPESMICMASVGEAAPVGSSIPSVIGLAGECVFKRKLVHCEDSRNDPRVGRDCSFGSAVILPLVVNGEVRGIVQAFSKRSFAFTASSMDSLEKLADAVIFSTHGIVTQRRLATAKSSLFPSSAPLGPKPGQALSPLTASFSTPAASAGASSPASDAAVMTPAAFPATSTPVAGVPTTSAYSTDLAPLPPAAHVASALAPPVAVKPVAVASLAEPIAEPVVQYVKPKPREKFTARPKVAPRHDRGKSQGGSTGKSSAGKWIAVTAAVAAISAASAWYAAKQHRQVAVVATASAAGPTLTQAPAYVQPVEVAHPVVSESPTLKAEAAVARTVVPTRVEHVVSPPAKHEAAPREPKPEPIVLAESAPRAPKPVDLDTVVPVKLPTALPTSPNASQIALPAEAKAIPKLAAPPVTVRTGPVLVSRVNPVYPQMARSARIQGVVELGVHIRKDGTVEKVTQLSGQAILAAAAKEAVQKWRYEPAKVNGQPIESDTTVKLTFDFYH